MSQKTIVINGITYDAHTGLPIKSAQEVPAEPARPDDHAHSAKVHQRTQRSSTLNRKIVAPAPVQPKPIRTMNDFSARPLSQAKTPVISKFAVHTETQVTPARELESAPVAHPIAIKVHQKAQLAPERRVAKPADVIKREAIAAAIEQAPAHGKRKQHEHGKAPRGNVSRGLSVASASLALILLGGYFTYINMPSISVRVAAAQAGIDATYPSYKPDGYSLTGPVAYEQGKVQMNFAANAGSNKFALAQTSSNWDSQAVLDNYIAPRSGSDYAITQDSGLTIYVYGQNAAWVNGGILYTIEGDAPLSADQVRRIATSM
ncbi:MAG: hypothetical protein WBB94_04800 [Candidatus Saccharimonadaceae bacterium]